jgi:protein-S-isoprenylcysteine O-methyltransferase Ste14
MIAAATKSEAAMLYFSVRVVLVLVGTALYLGLAILGWGGFQPFFADPARLALAIALVVVSLASLFAGGNISTGEREDRGNRWVLVPLVTIGLVSAYLPALTDRFDFWTIDGEALRWVGVVVFILGAALRLWPVYVLGRRFSGLVAIQKDHQLETRGIYRIIRHPSYLGLFVNALGWSLAFRSGVGILLTLLQIPPLAARIAAEERLLQSQFGAAYEAYRARTPRFIPGVL